MSPVLSAVELNFGLGHRLALLTAAAVLAAGCSQAPEQPLPDFRVRVLPSAPGEAASGREVFYREGPPKCWVCHAIGDEKDKAGPNLRDVGTRHGNDELLDALLNPSRTIAEGFEVQIFETTSQGLIVGVVARETPSLLVRNELGDEIEVPLNEVQSRRESELSMMPDDLTDSLSDQELLDLLAFLQSLKD